MFCNECGSVLNDGAKFCPLCGKPAPEPAEAPVAAPVADDITAVIPAIDGSADVTAEMPVAPPAYPPAYVPPAAYPPAVEQAPAYIQAAAPARTRSAAPIIIAIVLVVLLAMGGGAFALFRSGILGGGSGAKVDEGTSVDSDATTDSGDSTDPGTTGGTSTDGGVVVGDDTPPTGDPSDITPGGSALSASSTLKGYPASQLVDGKLDTCWAEGVSGYGSGQSFSANLGSEVWLSEVQIVPGYLKLDSANNVDRWYSNGRVTKAKLIFSDGSESITFDLDPDVKGWQIVKLPKAVKTSSVKVVILGTAPATTGTNHDAEDTSVSEIKLLGFPVAQ